MKNPPFVYHRPETLDEALAILAELGDVAKVLAGGQSLLPTMALRLGPPEHLVDINRLPGLDQITVDANGSVSIGALVRHAQAERSADLARHAPLISQAMPYIGHRAIRTQGTVVGSIAHADPAAEMPAVCLATDAVMVARSATGSREIAAAEFGQGYLTTALAADEILTEVRFPAFASTAVAHLEEVSRRHADYAMAGLACVIDAPSGTTSSAALAFFGVGNTAVRVPEAEAALVGKPVGDVTAHAEAAGIVKAMLDPASDVHASSNYRRHVAGVLTKRCLAEAAGKATTTGVPA